MLIVISLKDMQFIKTKGFGGRGRTGLRLGLILL